MKKADVQRIINAKFEALANQVVGQLKPLPGAVWKGYVDDLQRGESLFFDQYLEVIEGICQRSAESLPPPELELLFFGTEAHWMQDEGDPNGPIVWAEGVAAAILDRVNTIAADEAREEDAEPTSFGWNDEDLDFLARVATELESPAIRRKATDRDTQILQTAIATLRGLPEYPDEIELEINVSLRVNAHDEFSEISICSICLSPARIEISAGGSQYSPDVGSDSISYEQFIWEMGCEADRVGDMATWLQRLQAILNSNFSLSVTDYNAEPAQEDDENASND